MSDEGIVDDFERSSAELGDNWVLMPPRSTSGIRFRMPGGTWPMNAKGYTLIEVFCTCRNKLGAVGLCGKGQIVEVQFRCDSCDRHIHWRSA